MNTLLYDESLILLTLWLSTLLYLLRVFLIRFTLLGLCSQIYDILTEVCLQIFYFSISIFHLLTNSPLPLVLLQLLALPCSPFVNLLLLLINWGFSLFSSFLLSSFFLSFRLRGIDWWYKGYRTNKLLGN